MWFICSKMFTESLHSTKLLVISEACAFSQRFNPSQIPCNCEYIFINAPAIRPITSNYSRFYKIYGNKLQTLRQKFWLEIVFITKATWETILITSAANVGPEIEPIFSSRQQNQHTPHLKIVQLDASIPFSWLAVFRSFKCEKFFF